MQLQAQNDVLFSATPESYPGANDGKITATIADMNQNPPPYTFRIVETGEENPIEIQNNTGTATFTGLGYRNYCITVIMGNNCFAYGCFHFDEPCGPEGCLVADFDVVYTADGCAIQFLDWSREDASSWAWDFGDGSGSSERNPLHTYSSSGCYNVKLQVSNGNQSREILKEVCINACTDENAPLPDCEINAPSFAAPGQTINISVAGTGIAPFEYDWTTPGEIPPLPNGGEQAISALIPEDADNGDQFNFSVQLTDNNGYSTTCVHTVTVGGNIPDVEVSAFGSFQAGQPLVLVAFVDVFNLTGLEDYQFTIRQGNTLVEIPSSCLNVWQTGYDCTLPNGLPAGFYNVCVNVRDDAGVYEHCMDIVIGTPVTPPASPAMWLEVKSPSSPETDPLTGHYIVREGQIIRIGIDGSHPDPGFFGCDLNDYFVILKMENLATGVTQTFGEKFPIPNNQGFCDGIPFTCFTGDEDLDWSWPVGVGCKDGTLKITAEVYRVCNDEFECEKAYLITTPVFIDLYPGKPVIADVVIGHADCSHPVNVVLSSSCAITSYEWHFYDPYTNEEITDILEGNPNAETVHFNLGHAYFYQFPAGGVVKIRCKVIVVDDKGFTAEYVKLLTMLIPLRVDLPSTIYRCPDTWSNFSTSSIAVGASNQYEFEWSVVQPAGASLNFSSNDPNDPNPLFLSPLSGSKEYKVVVRSVNLYEANNVCEVEKNITVVVSTMSLNLPDIIWPICSTGGRQVGPVDPVNLGGSGHYTFEWGAANQADLAFLDDVHSSNPLISGIPVGQVITYSLTVTDIYGGCTASDQVTVRSIANDRVVTLTGDNVCYGEDAVLIAQGTPVESTPPFGDLFNQYHWTTTHPHHNLEGTGLYTRQLPISEITSTYPGTYTYTVRYQNMVSGCFAEASKEITIHPPFRHIGYESAIRTAIAGTNVPVWQASSTNDITSGVIETGPNCNASVSWSPHIPTDITYSNSGNPSCLVPRNGMFIPTETNPFTVMTVTNTSTGCSKEYKSFRYIIVDDKPELTIITQNRVSCLGDAVCFDLVFDPHVSNYQTSLLPPRIKVRYRFLPPSGSGQSTSATRFIDLLLINDMGLYKGTICENYFFIHETNIINPNESAHYRIEADVDPVDGKKFGYNPPFQYDCECQAKVLVDIKNMSIEPNLRTCFVANDHQVYHFSIHIGHPNDVPIACDDGHRIIRGDIEIVAGDFIEIHPGANISFEVLGQATRGPLLLIDPCMEESQSPSPRPEIDRNSDDNQKPEEPISRPNVISFEVIPNPFENDLKISCVIPAGFEDQESVLNILDMTGKRLRNIDRRDAGVGFYQVSFDTAGFPPGLYLIEMIVGNVSQLKKVVKI